MHNLRSIATLVVWFALALPSFADDELRLIPVFRHGTSFTLRDNLVVADLDGDNVNEVVLCNAAGPVALGARNGTYEVKWQGAQAGCYHLTVGDRDRDGGLEVLVSNAIRFYIYDPRSLSAPIFRQFPSSVGDIVLGNVDGDPAPEIVAVGSSATYVYDGETLELQWTATGYGGTSARIADVDGDSVSEIIVNGSTAAVLDGVTETQKWGYIGGFGDRWTTGNLDADAKDEIVFYDDGTMTILSGDTFGTVTWPGTGDSHYFALTVGDGNQDGTNEIIAGRSNLIAGYRPADGVEVWSVPVPDSTQMKGIAVSNLDGDSGLEVATSIQTYYGDTRPLTIVDRDTGEVEWGSPTGQGPYHIATGDLDNDGRLETVVSTRSIGGGYPGEGKIEIFDAETHALEGTIPVPPNYYGYLDNVAIAQADADAALEIVAIVAKYPNVLMSWDGVTRQHEFTSNAGSSLLPALIVTNLDADALDEIIVGTEDGQLLILNGASNFVQKSLQLTGTLRDAAVADLDGDSDLDLAVATYYQYLTVYDLTTWATLGQSMFWNIKDIDATSADGGTVVALSDYSGVRVFKGASLVTAYTCSGEGYEAAAFGEVAGATRLLVAGWGGLLTHYPLGGSSCPPLTVEALIPNATTVFRMQVIDGTGDGRNDLLVSSYSSAHVALLGVSSETRGDADGDGLVTTDDVDELAGYLLTGAAGISPSADANADRRIGIEDLFMLIDHELGSGGELQP